jgi:hypothetical protein
MKAWFLRPRAVFSKTRVRCRRVESVSDALIAVVDSLREPRGFCWMLRLWPARRAGWSVTNKQSKQGAIPISGGDLDKTFVAPPRDFVGVMNPTVKLSSAGGELLESQAVEFEWIAKTEDVLRAPGRAGQTTCSGPVTPSSSGAFAQFGPDRGPGQGRGRLAAQW